MTRNLLPLSLVTVCLCASPAARADECVPDYANWGGLFGLATMDQAVLAEWCYSGPLVSHYWNTLNLGHMGDYWWYYVNPDKSMDCQPDNYLVRLMDGAALMDQARYSLQNATLSQSSYDWRDQILVPHSQYSYVATCQYDPGSSTQVVASNPVPPSTDPTRLHYTFFWWFDVLSRASTLLHEALHDFYSHVPLSQAPCPNCGRSCDWYYGDPNGNVTDLQIAFLAEVIPAYVREPNSDQLMVVNWGNEVCGYLPYLSEATRWDATQTADFLLTSCYIYPGNPGPETVVAHMVNPNNPPAEDAMWVQGSTVFNADKIFNARWPCAAVCQVEDYQPGGAKYCNPDYQAANAEINAHNQSLCAAANAEIGEGVTPKERNQIQFNLYSSVEPCVPGYSGDFLAAYCESRLDAQNVAELVGSWDLPDQPGYADVEKLLRQCVLTYCQGKIDATWVSDARQACYEWSDGLGCADELCGELPAPTGEPDASYFQSVQCRRTLIENEGAGLFDPQPAGCDFVYAQCKNEKLRADWLADRAAGDCLFTTESPASAQRVPVFVGFQDATAVADVGTASYEQFKAVHANVEIDECLMDAVTCQAMADRMQDLVSRMLKEKTTPWNSFGPDDGPRPPQGDKTGIDIDDGMRWLVDFSTRPDASLGGFTSAMARNTLNSVGELRQATARALGEQNYFAVFGTRGQKTVFGSQSVTRFADAQFVAPTTGSPSLAGQANALAAAIPTRQRLDAADTQTLFGQAKQSLSESAFFSFASTAAQATSVTEIDTVLNQLQAAVGR